MNNAEDSLFKELIVEDNTGLVLRGLLHVEQQLIKFIARQLPHPDRVDWSKFNYTGKVELALSCGIDVDIRPPLEYLEIMRNNFAHSFDQEIEYDWVMQIYNGLPKQIKENVETSYKALSNKIGDKKSDTLNTRDLLVLIFIGIANLIQSQFDTLPERRTKPRPKKLSKKYMY